MASRPSRAGTAYEPLVPSPLNPRSHDHDELARRPRRGGDGKRAAFRSPTAANMSTAQRLLRHKAALAWRLQAPRRDTQRDTQRAKQVSTSAAGPSSVAMEAADGGKGTGMDRAWAARPRPEQGPGLYGRQMDGDEQRNDGEEDDDDDDDDMADASAPSSRPQHEGAPRQGHYDYLFRMPQVGIFTPQRVVLAVNVKRRLPLVGPHEVLRSARARRERDEGRRRAEVRVA